MGDQRGSGQQGGNAQITRCTLRIDKTPADLPKAKLKHLRVAEQGRSRLAVRGSTHGTTTVCD